MKKKLYLLLLIFLMPMTILAADDFQVKSSLNSLAKYEINDFIFVEHQVLNDQKYLSELKYINIYHSYDKEALEFIGVMPTIALEYCNFRDEETMTCSVVQETKFKTKELFATTVYKIKSKKENLEIKFNYSNSKIKDKTKDFSLKVLVDKEKEESNKDTSSDSKVESITTTFLELEKGKTQQITLSPELKEFELSELNFKSSNNKIAQIDNKGTIKALNIGNTTITVTKDELTQIVNLTVPEPVNESKTNQIILVIVAILIVIGIYFLARKVFSKKSETDIYIGD